MPKSYFDTDPAERWWARHPWGAFWLVLGVTAVICVAGFFVNQAVRRTTAPIEGQTQQIEQTQGNASFRIQSYEWYFNQCAAIQAAEDRITNQFEELETVEESSSRFGQIQANLTAQRNVRDENIREYNAEARKEETSGPFRAEDLPYQISVDAEATSCTY